MTTAPAIVAFEDGGRRGLHTVKCTGRFFLVRREET